MRFGQQNDELFGRPMPYFSAELPQLAASEKESHKFKLKNEGFEIMIDIAEKQLKVPIRKKSSSGS